jgi:hypothetical protein
MNLNGPAILHSRFMAGAVTGLVSAAAVDFVAFRQWKSFNDMYEYQWGTATFRWFQGFVIGGLTGIGFGAVLGPQA